MQMVRRSALMQAMFANSQRCDCCSLPSRAGPAKDVAQRAHERGIDFLPLADVFPRLVRLHVLVELEHKQQEAQAAPKADGA